MTYQPKSAGKMADFEILKFWSSVSPCILSQICTYCCKDLVTAYCLYLGKNWILKRHLFSNRFYYTHLVAMGLPSRGTRALHTKYYCRMSSLTYTSSTCDKDLKNWKNSPLFLSNLYSEVDLEGPARSVWHCIPRIHNSIKSHQPT